MSLSTIHRPDPLDSPSDWQPNPREVNAEMARITRGMLPKIGAGLGFLFCVFALGHWFILPPPGKYIMTTAALLTAVGNFAIALYYRRPQVSESKAIAFAVAISFAVVINSSLHLWVDPRPAQTTNFLLLMVGTALFVLTTRGFVAVTVATWIAWLSIVSQAPPHPDWSHFGFALFSITLVAGLAHVLVVRHLAQLYALHRRDLVVQEQLNSALDEAQQAARAKDQFLAAMSHELRTPLNSIIGFSNLLAKNPEQMAPRQLSFVDRIQRNGNHLLSLIDQLLNLSRIASGRLEVQKTDIDLLQLIHEIVADQQYGARQKGLVLRAEAPSSLLSLHTDAARLRQILLNLVANAIKFTDQGAVTVSLRAKDGHGHSISVSDTGRGIAPDDLQKVFERFTQVESGTARNFEGTGLGLTISRELSRLLGYELSAESALGKGSTFTLWLQPEARRPGSESDSGNTHDV